MGLVSYLPRVWNYTQRAAKVWDIAVVGDGAKVLEKVYSNGLKKNKNIFTKDFYSNFWKTTKTAGKELEAYKAAEVATHGTTWKVICNNFKNIPASFKTGWARGAKYAKLTGKNKFLSQIGMAFKKCGKSIGRVAGPALILAFELPNIFRATKNEGIGSGLIETGKAAAKLGGWTLGAAIGQALIPIPVVGAIVGGIAGDLLVSKIVGKSYSEKQAEKEEEIAKAVAQAQQAQGTCQNGACGTTQPTFAGDVPQQTCTTNPYAQGAGITPQQFAFLQQQSNLSNTFSDDIMFNSTFNAPQRLNYQA